MTDPVTQLAERAKRQTEMTVLMLKLQEERVRFDAATTLDCRSEKEATESIRQHLTPATLTEIIQAITETEKIKGKIYPKNPAYAGIHQTLHQARITKAELATWLQETLRTTYCSGNKYQPLPTHDEAWQTYSKIHAATTSKRYAAETLRYRTKPAIITDAELKQAAEWGFWDDMPLSLHRRLYKLMPVEKRTDLYSRCTPDQALTETRKHWDKTYV